MASFSPGQGIPLEPGITYETIFTAYDVKGMPHATPIGIRRVIGGPGSESRLEATIFTTTRMYACLSRNRDVVINFPTQSQVRYFLLAFKSLNLDLVSDLASPARFVPCSTVNAPRIKDINRYLEARVLERRILDVNDAISKETRRAWKKCAFTLEIVDGAWGKQDAAPVSRLQGLFLEFLVLASKFQAIDLETSLSVQMRMEAEKLLERLERVGRDHELVSTARKIAGALSLAVLDGKHDTT